MHQCVAAGVNIGEGGANAIKLCGAVLSQIQQEIPGSCLLGTQDGTAMNAIPTECKALVAVSEIHQHRARGLRGHCPRQEGGQARLASVLPCIMLPPVPPPNGPCRLPRPDTPRCPLGK